MRYNIKYAKRKKCGSRNATTFDNYIENYRLLHSNTKKLHYLKKELAPIDFDIPVFNLNYIDQIDVAHSYYILKPADNQVCETNEFGDSYESVFDRTYDCNTYIADINNLVNNNIYLDDFITYYFGNEKEKKTIQSNYKILLEEIIPTNKRYLKYFILYIFNKIFSYNELFPPFIYKGLYKTCKFLRKFISTFVLYVYEDTFYNHTKSTKIFETILYNKYIHNDKENKCDYHYYSNYMSLQSYYNFGFWSYVDYINNPFGINYVYHMYCMCMEK